MTGTMAGMYEKHTQDIAQSVHEARLAAGLSKEAVARKAEVSSITYKRVEDGEPVRDASLARVLGALDLVWTGEGVRPITEVDPTWGRGGAPASVGGDTEGGEEFEFLTRVREDLTTEEMDTLMEELNPYLERLVRDIKRRRD